MKTMLDILKERLPEGLIVISCKEFNAKYKLKFEYKGNRAIAELPKVCAPGCQNTTVDNTIITAMSTIMINCGDYKAAKEWLDKLSNG